MAVDVSRFLNQPITIYPAVTTTDQYNAETVELGEPVQTVGFIQQSSSTEFLNGRDTVVSQWTLYLPAGTAISPLAQVGFGSQIFQVTGQPVNEWNPINARVDYVRCDLTVVS